MMCIFVSDELEHTLELKAGYVKFLNHVAVIKDRPDLVLELMESTAYAEQRIRCARPEWEEEYIAEAQQASGIERDKEGSCLRTFQHSFHMTE